MVEGGVPPDGMEAPDRRETPAFPVHLRKEGVDIRLLSCLTTVAAPLEVGLQEIRMATFLPTDAESEAFLRGR